MRSIRDVSIRTKLMLLLVGVVSVALVLSMTAMAINDVRIVQSLVAKRVVTLADMLGANCTAALNFEVRRTAEEVLDSLRLQSAIVFARVYDKDDEIFAEYALPGYSHIAPPELRKDDHPFSQAGHLHVFRPIIQDNEQIGIVYLQANKSMIYEQLRGYALAVTVVLVVSLSITTLLAYRVQRVISRPIDRLVAATQQVAAESDFSIRVVQKGNDELGLLCDAFNSMLAQIEQRDAELEQHRLHLEELVQERTQNLEAKTAELAQSTVELERSNVELQQFAFVASHDLQEPLRKIQAFGDLLRSKQADMIDEQSRDYLQRMQNAAARMRTLIDGLLSYSRVRSKSQPFEQIDLNSAAHSVVADLESRIQQSGGRVEIGPLHCIDADGMQMRQLLQNLIGNALKFHRPGVPPVVRVEDRIVQNGDAAQLADANSDELCQIVVQDNGIGFDEKYVDRIFLPFQRLHGRDEFEGTGMGLAICRKIVERHGGTLTAKSILGQGTTFTTTLPVRQNTEESTA